MGKINIIVDLTRIGCQVGGTLLMRFFMSLIEIIYVLYMMIISTIKYQRRALL